MSGPSSPASRAAAIALRDPRLGQRVLAADVEVALLGARRVAGDRHRLDDRERVLLEQGPILERPGLRLVGVADEVVGPGRLRRDRGPLAAGRERGPAATDELGRGDLVDHRAAAPARAPGRAPGSRRWRDTSSRLVGSTRPIRREQPEPRRAGLRDRASGARSRRASDGALDASIGIVGRRFESGDDAGRVDRRDGDGARRFARRS